MIINWLCFQGEHPTELGVAIDMKACFDGVAKGTCNYNRKITVTRCSDFFVYYLVTTPYNGIRYCSDRDI
jgi:hypothetical protein